jgi:hypothetical protein
VRRAAAVAVLLVLAGPLVAPPRDGTAAPAGATAAAPKAAPLPPEVVRGHCAVCHSWALVQQQQLDRANWEWVMDDMIGKYGATWIDPVLRTRIVDYLVEHHGPAR